MDRFINSCDNLKCSAGPRIYLKQLASQSLGADKGQKQDLNRDQYT